MSEQLLPCPFCGGTDLMVFCDPEEALDNTGPSRRVQCGECHVEAPFYDTKDEAVAAWNRRAALTPAPQDQQASTARLVSVGNPKGLKEGRASLVARQVRQTMRDYGHRCAETSLPEYIAGDVHRVLEAQDVAHPAPQAEAAPSRDGAPCISWMDDPDAIVEDDEPQVGRDYA